MRPPLLPGVLPLLGPAPGSYHIHGALPAVHLHGDATPLRDALEHASGADGRERAARAMAARVQPGGGVDRSPGSRDASLCRRTRRPRRPRHRALRLCRARVGGGAGLHALHLRAGARRHGRAAARLQPVAGLGAHPLRRPAPRRPGGRSTRPARTAASIAATGRTARHRLFAGSASRAYRDVGRCRGDSRAGGQCGSP